MKLNNILRFWLRFFPSFFLNSKNKKCEIQKKKKFTFSHLIFNFKDNFTQIKYNNFVRAPKIMSCKNPSSNHPRFMQIERNTWLIKYISQHVGIFLFFLSFIYFIPFPFTFLHFFFFLLFIRHIRRRKRCRRFNEIEQQKGKGGGREGGFSLEKC